MYLVPEQGQVLALGIPQHADKHRPKDPILLAAIRSSANMQADRGHAPFDEYPGADPSHRADAWALHW